MHRVQLLECNVKQIANAQGDFEFNESDLTEFVHHETLAVLDRLFTQWDQQWQYWPNAAATINELTISLPHPVNRQQPQRFQQQLFEALREALLNALPEPLQTQWQLTDLLTHFENAIRYRQARFARRDWQLIAERLATLTSTNREPVQTCLLRLLQHKQTRGFIAQQFSDALLATLFEVLSPEQASFIVSVIQQADQFAVLPVDQPRSNAALPVIASHDKAVTKQQIAEFSLAFISVQRGSRFNRTRYLRHVLQSIAAHDNTSFSELCEVLHRAAEQAPENRLWRQELLDITQPDEHHLEPLYSPSNPQQTELECYEKIRIALQQSQPVNASLWQLFFQLTKHDSSLLTALLRQVLVLSAWRRHFRKTLPASLHSRVITHLKWLLPDVVLGSEPHSLKAALRLFSPAALALWGEEKTTHEWLKLPLGDQSFTVMLAQQPGVLRDRLLAHPAPNRMIQALINHLPPSQLEALVRIVNPRVATFWRRYGVILRHWLYALTVIQPQAADRAYWYTALQFAWNVSQGRQSLTLSNMLVSLIRRLRLESRLAFQLNESDMLLQLQPILSQKGPALAELWSATEQIIASQLLTPAVPDKTVRTWLQIVERSLRHHQPLALASLPDISNSAVQHAVQPILLGWLREASVRQRFLALTEKSQQRLLMPLLPKRSESLLALWQADFTKARITSAANANVIPSAKARYEIRLFCLIYLANERGSQFNQHSFGRTLVRRLSAHFNLQAEAFLLQLKQALPADKHTQHMFSWLWSDMVAIDHSPPMTEGAEVTAADTSWLALQQLNDLLHNAIQSSLPQWRACLSALLGSQPLCLLQWFRSLQNDPEQITPLRLHSDGRHILHLILATLLKVTGHTNRLDGQVLLSAIEHYANTARQVSVFYELTIKAVLAGHVLDMDALLTQANHAPKNHSVDVAQLTALPDKKNTQMALTAQALLTDRQAFLRFTQWSVEAQWQWFKQHAAHTLARVWPALFTLQQLVVRFDIQIHQARLHEATIRLLLQCSANNNTAVDHLIQRWVATAYSLSQASDRPQWLAQLVQHLNDDIALFTMLSPSQRSSVLSLLQATLVDFTEWDLVTDTQLTAVCSDATEVVSGRFFRLTEQDVNQVIRPLVALESVSQATTNETVSALTPDQDHWQFASFGGLVILAPYWPALFSQLNLLRDQTFIDEASCARAAQVLHYLCLGESDYFQPNDHIASMVNVILNRPLNHPLNVIELTTAQKQLCDSLLLAVIQHWSALGKTSLEGLRETFLQRDAFIRLDTEKGWMIRIKRRPFDVLLERLPWSFRTIKHPFMPYCLNVEW